MHGRSLLGLLGPLTLALSTVVAAVGAGACTDSGTGSSSSGGACAEYQVPAGFDLANPAVSFKNDVGPIFQLSCAFGSCHGSATGGNNGVYIGAESARFIGAAVGKPSNQLTSMSFVTAGDPKKSYLMHKLDHDACAFDKQCAGGSCFDPMPLNSKQLAAADRDKIRRWIAQGAKDN